MIAVAAGEAKDPRRAIVRAFRATVFRLVFFYLCTLALIVAIVPFHAAGSSGSPFVTVMAATRIPGAAGVVNFVILVAALSAMNSQLYITSRMMFSLSRAGYAPRRLGELNSRGTPAAALWLSTTGVALAATINALYPETSFTLMMSISMFGAMFTWLMIFITHLFFRRGYRGGALTFRMWLYPYGTLLGAGLMVAVLITTAFTREFRMTLVYGVPFLMVLTVFYRIRTNSFADSLIAWRKEFPILEHTTYMISHSLGAMPRGVEDAMREFTGTWASRGIRAWEEELVGYAGHGRQPDWIDHRRPWRGRSRHAPERFDLWRVLLSRPVLTGGALETNSLPTDSNFSFERLHLSFARKTRGARSHCSVRGWHDAADRADAFGD